MAPGYPTTRPVLSRAKSASGFGVVGSSETQSTLCKPAQAGDALRYPPGRWAAKARGGYNKMRTRTAKLRIGLLNKKRGNFAIQEKLIGADNVVDETDAEVEHHEQALTKAGYSVYQIRWGPNFINDLEALQVDLVFNVSSLVEAAILEELEIPYVGSDTFTIAIATDKSLAKRL
ncbi:hypothetical protein, partial [Neptuniibacter sp.]|uniref:hypothetical protein n=1 Tax=Neptuniibacter sp. TaxID=1962643 RepID=UPI002615AF8F